MAFTITVSNVNLLHFHFSPYLSWDTYISTGYFSPRCLRCSIVLNFKNTKILVNGFYKHPYNHFNVLICFSIFQKHCTLTLKPSYRSLSISCSKTDFRSHRLDINHTVTVKNLLHSLQIQFLQVWGWYNSIHQYSLGGFSAPRKAPRKRVESLWSVARLSMAQDRHLQWEQSRNQRECRKSHNLTQLIWDHLISSSLS